MRWEPEGQKEDLRRRYFHFLIEVILIHLFVSWLNVSLFYSSTLGIFSTSVRNLGSAKIAINTI
jgi:hypothetical protein